jgi:3-oxoacyl-[acyl-carrier-protein] synthase II
MSNKRVVVTGLGVISSIGIDRDRFWNNLLQGKSGISKIEMFDTAKFNRHFGGEIKDFDPSKYIPKEMIRFVGRASRLAIASTKFALADASLSSQEIKNGKAAVVMGVTIPEGSAIDFSSEMMLKEKPESVKRRILLSIFAPSVSRNIGHFFKIKGINILLPNACAAGNYSIGYGFDLIRGGEVDLAITGGAEALSRISFQGFQSLYAMSPDICSPFDKDRKGMLLGEGAGILILESLDRALKRKAKIYAEVLGYGLSCDAHHITAPQRDGIKKAMEKAIRNSGLTADKIDYVSAHGTGTHQNDKEESVAIKELFGRRRVPVSSIKSMLGHTMGAASAIEAIVCCMAIKDSVVPPTINFKTPDPECDIDCVANKARKLKVKVVLNNAFAFGGNNCCVVFGH